MEIATYKANGIKFGRQHGQALIAGTGDTYYDAIRVYQQLGVATGEDFSAEEAAAIKAYRDGYVIPNNGAIPGYWSFTDGLTQHALRTGDAESKRAAILISQNAAYHQDSVPEGWTADPALSREVAYAILAMLNAEKLGESRRPRLKLLVAQALGHLDAMFVSRTVASVKPFMGGLTGYALIRYYEQADKDKRILPAIKTVVDWLWSKAWMADRRGFYYETAAATDLTQNLPDLNMLILPVFAWAWKMLDKPKYRLTRAQEVFDGGVAGAYLQGQKQFNQNYLRGFESLTWLEVAAPIELETLKTELKAANARLDKIREALK